MLARGATSAAEARNVFVCSTVLYSYCPS